MRHVAVSCVSAPSCLYVCRPLLRWVTGFAVATERQCTWSLRCVCRQERDPLSYETATLAAAVMSPTHPRGAVRGLPFRSGAYAACGQLLRGSSELSQWPGAARRGRLKGAIDQGFYFPPALAKMSRRVDLNFRQFSLSWCSEDRLPGVRPDQQQVVRGWGHAGYLQRTLLITTLPHQPRDCPLQVVFVLRGGLHRVLDRGLQTQATHHQ